MGLITRLLSGCRLFQPMDGPDMEYHGEDDLPPAKGAEDEDASARAGRKDDPPSLS